VVERGPIPAIHGVARWWLIDLVQWLHEEFAVRTRQARHHRSAGEMPRTEPG
jgi:hypothetical protein